MLLRGSVDASHMPPQVLHRESWRLDWKVNSGGISQSQLEVEPGLYKESLCILPLYRFCGNVSFFLQQNASECAFETTNSVGREYT